MESPKTIPLGRQIDPLRHGIHGVKSDIIESHPLESAYRTAKVKQEEMKKKILTNTYGAAFPMKMVLDRQILTKFQSPPGAIPSSFLGLEAMTGTLEGFGFEDYLNEIYWSAYLLFYLVSAGAGMRRYNILGSRMRKTLEDCQL
ncbi:Proteasome maturation factor UMP1 [Forsythia ovata]|uniref:Proteasome maturation factor UMP1 n=1 Tax=Forsythia ovata TaxID=205694 RepID=A0ABD1WR27_9LAMI